MAFTIYHSNHLDSLQYMASYLIKEKPLDNPLLPEYFIIHSSGMTNWLKSALATEHNIFANTRLEFPINQIVTIIENLLTDDERSQTNLRISRLTLTWTVFDILKNNSLDDLEILQRYLSLDNSQQTDVRIMSLAEEIAGLFDKYLAYRPDWFMAWQKNESLFPELSDEIWQQKIWQEVYQKVIPKYYLANIVSLLKNLPKERYNNPKIPTRLFVIGISTLPPLFIELLHVLSEHIEVHLLFTNPSQFYWGDLTQYRNKNTKRIIFKNSELSTEQRENIFSPDIEDIDLEIEENISEQWLEFHGNPFLASFGKIGRDFIHLLSQYDDVSEIEAFSEPTTKGLLGQVQKEIFNLSPVKNEQDKFILDSSDRSIAFHSHYSERREVEGLYDQLLHAFQNNPDLEPKDIIVMVSDIDRYRPMIEAVFGSPFRTEMKIPFTISDFTLGKHEPILDAFLLLLNITDSNFSATELLMLLDIPEIAERFQIGSSDRDLVRKWVENCNIKFGIDRKHLKELNIREDDINTWLWGLKRLLLGYGLNDMIEIDHVMTFPYVQGSEAITLGHLVDFVDALINLKSQLSEPHSLEEWQTILPQIWTDFYINNDETQLRLQYLQPIWNGFIAEGQNLKFDKKISINLIQRHLNEHLSSFRPESRFLTGSINFCTFIPMRSIPFKIVCMLGMNQDSFPHSKQYPEYDLMQMKPQRGDRSTVNDERYLFLEAILSAQEQLYISYIGKNIQNNSEMFPSLFVNELQHYLEEIAKTDTTELVTELLTIQHPLSPFSPLLFEENSSIQSFQKEWLPTLSSLDETAFEVKNSVIKNLTVKELIDAFKTPLEMFGLKNFGIKFYDNKTSELESDELFSLSEQDSLEKYNARYNLLQELFYNEIPDDLLSHYASNELFECYRKEGKLPKFAFAKLDWNVFIEPILKMVLAARARQCEFGAQQQIYYKIGDVLLEGALGGTDSDQQCFVFVGDFNYKRQVSMFITHLLNTLRLQKNTTTTIFYIEKSEVYETAIEPIDINKAYELLELFINGYQENLIAPFLILNQKTLRQKDQKILDKHLDFIEENFISYDVGSISKYLSSYDDLQIEIFDRVMEDLKNQKSLIMERFVGEVTYKEIIGTLYFVLKYGCLLKFKKREKLK